MGRHLLIYLLLSLLVVIFARYVHLIIVYIDLAYTWVNLKLQPLISDHFQRSVLCLVLLPTLMVGIPALAYRLIRGQSLPYQIQAAWMIWAVIVLSKVLI